MGADQWSENQAEALRVAIGRFVRAGRRSDEISPSRAGVLGDLDRCGPLAISELADLAQVRHQSMRQTVHLLQATGWITISAHGSDARKKSCTISASGRAALERDRSARTRWILAVANHQLDDDERTTAALVPALLARFSDGALPVVEVQAVAASGVRPGARGPREIRGHREGPAGRVSCTLERRALGGMSGRSVPSPTVPITVM